MPNHDGSNCIRAPSGWQGTTEAKGATLAHTSSDAIHQARPKSPFQPSSRRTPTGRAVQAQAGREGVRRRKGDAGRLENRREGASVGATRLSGGGASAAVILQEPGRTADSVLGVVDAIRPSAPGTPSRNNRANEPGRAVARVPTAVRRDPRKCRTCPAGASVAWAVQGKRGAEDSRRSQCSAEAGEARASRKKQKKKIASSSSPRVGARIRQPDYDREEEERSVRWLEAPGHRRRRRDKPSCQDLSVRASSADPNLEPPPQ
mmetsp:Transcript_26195/g.58676  ORF Transcript_26195/g.58676 Transcript_26195/m.58676 type:complete len:262 (+) Transcript_26195:68-853(+)